MGKEVYIDLQIGKLVKNAGLCYGHLRFWLCV